MLSFPTYLCFFPGGSSYLRSYRLTNSDRIGHGNRTPLGKGMFIWDRARPIPRLGTSAPQFGGYRLVMPIPFDLDQLFRHGNRNTRGKVRFRGRGHIRPYPRRVPAAHPNFETPANAHTVWPIMTKYAVVGNTWWSGEYLYKISHVRAAFQGPTSAPHCLRFFATYAFTLW